MKVGRPRKKLEKEEEQLAAPEDEPVSEDKVEP
jgi:hypothetical protein